MSKSKSLDRPLVVHLSNVGVSADLQSLDFLRDIEAKYPVVCTVLQLDGKSSSDPEIERQRTEKCVDTLKEAIKVCVSANNLIN
jgi:hypothetical protein